METGTHDTGTFRSEGTQTEDARAKARELTRTARERALSAVDQGKEQLCGVLDRAAGSIHDDPLGSYAAEYARRGSEYLRRHSADDLYRSARRSLRARPGVMLAACFVAGLAFARLVKGTAGRDDGWRDEERDVGPGSWSGLGQGESGYREGSWATPDPLRGTEPRRGGQP